MYKIIIVSGEGSKSLPIRTYQNLSEPSGSYRSEYLTKDLNFKVSCRDWKKKSLKELC